MFVNGERIHIKNLFKYNWMIRREWFEWCKQLSHEELVQERIGGVGSILKTLFHIVDVEYSWIQILKGQQEFTEGFEKYATLEKVVDLSNLFHVEVEQFVLEWTELDEEREIMDSNELGEIFKLKHGEVMRHIVAHEIHHIGQLSVWARELDLVPINSNYIRRGI